MAVEQSSVESSKHFFTKLIARVGLNFAAAYGTQKASEKILNKSKDDFTLVEGTAVGAACMGSAYVTETYLSPVTDQAIDNAYGYFEEKKLAKLNNEAEEMIETENEDK